MKSEVQPEVFVVIQSIADDKFVWNEEKLLPWKRENKILLKK